MNMYEPGYIQICTNAMHLYVKNVQVSESEYEEITCRRRNSVVYVVYMGHLKWNFSNSVYEPEVLGHLRMTLGRTPLCMHIIGT